MSEPHTFSWVSHHHLTHSALKKSRFCATHSDDLFDSLCTSINMSNLLCNDIHFNFRPAECFCRSLDPILVAYVLIFFRLIVLHFPFYLLFWVFVSFLLDVACVFGSLGSWSFLPFCTWAFGPFGLWALGPFCTWAGMARMDRNDPQWPVMARNGLEWPGIARNDQEWPGIACYRPE